VRFLRVVGTLLVVASSANAFFWLFDTLLPIHRVTRLQPLPMQTLTEIPIGDSVLLECHRNDSSKQSDPNLLLNCAGQSVLIQSSQPAIHSLSMMFPPSEGTSFQQFLPNDPIVAVGSLIETHPNHQVLRLSADLVAYGNRNTYLGSLREKSMAQVIWTYALGGLGIAALLIDWQLSQKSGSQQPVKQTLKTAQQSPRRSPPHNQLR
jgi:hypothetical protein